MFKSYKYWLNEKFVENSDPIKDLGIGIFCKRDFKSEKEFYKFLAPNILHILKIQKLPKTFVITTPDYRGGIMKGKYHDKITEYINKYITINGKKINGQDLFTMGEFARALKHNVYIVNYDEYLNQDKIGGKLDEAFTLDSDPIEDLGIGLKTKIETWLRQMGITAYRLTPELEINVYDDVLLARKMNATEFPEYIQFNIAVGDFSIAYNSLTSLRGCPREIWGYFNCSGNKLESLEGAPKEIKKTKKKSGGFYCTNNTTKKFTEEEIRAICDVEGRVTAY